MNPHDLKIVDNIVDISSESIEDEKVNLEDTATLLNSYVEALDVEDHDKNVLKSMLSELHTEATDLNSI